MATPRRPLPATTEASEKPGSHQPSNTSPLVPQSTIIKLLIFTVAMFTLPLLSYFASLHALFGGNSSYAGGLAALMANVVLGGYIVAAVREDGGQGSERLKQGIGKAE